MEYVPFAFGVAESWWCAEEQYRSKTPLILICDWIKVLESTGFRVDFTVSDAQLSTVYACIAATYVGPKLSIAPTLKAPQPALKALQPPLEALQSDLEAPDLSIEGALIILHRHTLTTEIEQLTQTLVSSIEIHEIIPVSFDSPSFEIPNGASWILSLLEIEEPLLVDISLSDFKKFSHIITASVPVLWVTSGVHLVPKNPGSAMITGFARSLRNETDAMNFNLLDLSSNNLTETATYIASLVKSLMGTQIPDDEEATRMPMSDWEFCEYQGLRYVPRVWLDTETAARYSAQNDHRTLMEPYAQNEKNLGLVCSQRGILGSLAFKDKGLVGSELLADHVEISPDMFGLHSEDITNALDITPLETLGIACSGKIRRIGSRVEGLSVGDRIFTVSPNEFKNRFCIPAAGCRKIPEDTHPIDFTGSFVVYATVVRGLVHIADIQTGETILIHRAAGAIGLAAIQLCIHLGAEIFATCGSIEEAKFLTETHNILPSRIFSASDKSFREGIKAATGGEGVDVILNLLGGDLLHESWKCLAPGGRFIDIGKRDILLSGKLDMNGFKRNTVYAAVDLTGMMAGGNKLLDRLLKDVIRLFNDGAIKPIGSITQLPITEAEEAFRRMSTDTHIGNIVLTVDLDTGAQQMVKVVQSPNEVRFDPEGTYLLVGGLGGIGCSLGVWMAEKGAKHLTFMTRSGAHTAEAKRTLKDIASLGCGVDVLRCDVGDFDQVERAIASFTRPLRGIIHGAMALKDSIFENMEHSDFIVPLRSKVNGLLNLEKVLNGPHYPKLDFFIVLSSICGVLGTPGQTNYAAAGAFEDAFVRTRQRNGQQASVLDLGVISNVGYVSQNPELERRLMNQPGIGSYNERQLQWLFRIALDTPIINPATKISRPEDFQDAQIVTGVDLDPVDIGRLRDTNWFQDPKWGIIDSIISGTSEGMGEGMFGDENALNARLRDLLNNVNKQPTADVIVNIAQCVIWKTAVMTMIPVEEITQERPLSHYGMDSLSAVEMRNWFLRVGAVELKVDDILAAVSIRKLAEKVYNGYTQKGVAKGAVEDS